MWFSLSCLGVQDLVVFDYKFSAFKKE